MKCSRTIVFDWHNHFRDVRVTTAYNSRTGKPLGRNRKVDEVKDILQSDRKKFTDSITGQIVLRHVTVQKLF